MHGGAHKSGWLRYHRDITFLKFFPVLVTVTSWGENFQKKKARFWCGNIINRQWAKIAQVMRLVMAFVLHCLCFNILFHAVHGLGMDNGLAEVLSISGWQIPGTPAI